MENIIMMSDSYKYSHYNQYPKGMNYMFSYMEARSKAFFDKSLFFGLQYFIKKYLMKKITEQDINEVKEFCEFHGIPFNYEGWKYIANLGYLPIKIKAVEEGSVIPNKNVLMTIESTDENVPWVVGWVETLLLKMWYPITVATKSFYTYKVIEKYYKKTVDQGTPVFQFHNFGDRGSSSVESAAIAGMAHLTVFKGSDNFNSLKYQQEYYGEACGFSIPASEHSTVTSYTKEGRKKFYADYIETYKNYPIIACVMDSYDIFEDVNFVTSGEMKKKIESDEYPIFVIRPDSGDPIDTLRKLLNIMETNNVSYTVNKKGYKVFDKYRFIWGDGIDLETIEIILELFMIRGYSAENIAFGSGGDLVQKINRDTLGFAIKCSYIEVDGKGVDVFKDPITDKNKVSKKGKLDLVVRDGKIVTINENEKEKDDVSILKTVFENGKLLKEYNFGEIKERVSSF